MHGLFEKPEQEVDLENKTIVIIGGTGTLGHELCSQFLKNRSIKEIRIFSRDEFKQYNMKNTYQNDPLLKFLIGDCCNYERVLESVKGADIVIHAAALKHVAIVEENPFEAIRVNIYGTENVVKACVANKVPTLIGISTDKCVTPANLYGATKLCLEKVILYANILSNFETRSCVVRYGNVLASRGSVVPLFLKQRESGVLTITNQEMTRFTLTISDTVDLIKKCINKMTGGEIFVPIIPSYNILQLAKVIGPECQLKMIGLRQGEKLHESMISVNESNRAIKCENEGVYVIIPDSLSYDYETFRKAHQGSIQSKPFEYNSLENEYISDEKLKSLVFQTSA